MQHIIADEMSHFGRIVTNSPIGIAMIDQQGHWFHFNTSFLNLLGYTLEELSETLFFDHLSDPSLFSAELQALISINSDRLSRQISTPLIHKNGDLIWASVTCSLLPPFSETPIVYCVQIIDRTPLKITEEQLLTSNRLSSAGQLAAGMAHEVRNPLTAIKGFVQLLKREKDNKVYLDVIESEINRMENMLNEFLLLGKPKKETRSLFSFKDLITHVITLIHSQAIMNQINIEVEVEEGLPDLVGDDARLKQVFINLLKNAIEAMEHAGCIRLTVNKEDQAIITTIHDQGPGIPEEKLQLLGSPFYSTKDKGTGLGLMMCFLIVKEHNGKLHISSDSSGTTVQVHLPLGLAESKRSIPKN